MASDILLALGLVLSTASQLRPAGAPVGPGEAFLMVWVVMMLGREIGRLGPPLTPAFCALLLFWLVFGASLGIGTLAGYVIGDVHDPDLFLHDAVAYPVLALVSCLSVVGPGAGARMHRRARLFVGLGTAALALQLAGAYGLPVMGRADPWYWDRFRGWSANPLQLALLCTILTLMALHLADAAVSAAGRIAALACGALAVYVGRLTHSDSLTLALIAAGPIFIALKLRQWMRPSGYGLPLRAAAAAILAFGAPLLLVSALPLGSAISDAADLARTLAKDDGRQVGDEADLRFGAWKQAIARGIESGFLGLGPGPHLDIPPVLVVARATEIDADNVDHPPANGVPDFEAHNTVLDLFTQGGLLAVAGILGLMATAFVRTWRAYSAGLTTLLASLAIFAIPNLIIRHPIVWFAIAVCLVPAAAPGDAETGS
jgi:O-antigen ligase